MKPHVSTCSLDHFISLSSFHPLTFIQLKILSYSLRAWHFFDDLDLVTLPFPWHLIDIDWIEWTISVQSWRLPQARRFVICFVQSQPASSVSLVLQMILSLLEPRANIVCYYHYEQQKSEHFFKFVSLTNPQLVGKGRKILIPSKQRSENMVKDPLKHGEFRLFPPLENVAIFNTLCFILRTFTMLQTKHPLFQFRIAGQLQRTE
jgi:hypothetical protein